MASTYRYIVVLNYNQTISTVSVSSDLEASVDSVMAKLPYHVFDHNNLMTSIKSIRFVINTTRQYSCINVNSSNVMEFLTFRILNHGIHPDLSLIHRWYVLVIHYNGVLWSTFLTHRQVLIDEYMIKYSSTAGTYGIKDK